MKIRSDYVSNSSSSSFIIIAKNGKDETNDIVNQCESYSDKWSVMYIPNENGHDQFGWEFENYNDFASKLNFIGIQLLELLVMKSEGKVAEFNDGTPIDFDKCYDMLIKVCKEKFNFNVALDNELLEVRMCHDDERGYYTYIILNGSCYIDHQSCVTENSCMEMFESEDNLYDFLRFHESYVEGGNDNG